MQGAHLYSPGVKSCQGLRSGMKATVQVQNGILVGSGIAREGETAILNYHQGIAVEILNSRFRLPRLRESIWYESGLFHPHSLESMVACPVLVPVAADVIFH